jgi:hypothetical protein
MTPTDPLRLQTRRHFFQQCGVGLGALALTELMGRDAGASLQATVGNPLASKRGDFRPKAKRVIYLFMAGAPSQIDLFDHKPKLNELHDKPIPEEFVKG